MSVRTYRLDLSYEGTRFHGWAHQHGSDLRTVEGAIGAALEKLFGGTVPITVAGRTDAGVHALGQVVSFALPSAAKDPPEDFAAALNALTPHDITINAVAQAASGFDARRDALSRRYRYRIDTNRAPSPFDRRFALHFPYRLDRDSLDAAAVAIVGRHDFTAFTPTETEHVHFHREVLAAEWSERPAGILEIEIEADAFMRRMVRILVGTMLEVGSGRRDGHTLSALLEGRPRAGAGETAPPHGLFLLAVRYRD